MAKYEVNTASYAEFDMEDGASLASIAKSLATAIGKPKKFVPGFLVASMRMLHKSGNATPLLTFMAAADLKTEQLAARMIGALSGVDNKGKPRVQWQKTKGKFNWGTWRSDGTINETAAEILTKAHGVHQFDSPTVTKALFPKRDTAPDYQKKLTATRKALETLVNESDISIPTLRQMLQDIDDALVAKATSAHQPTMQAVPAVIDTAEPHGIRAAVNH